MMHRTNILLNEELVKTAMQVTGLETRKALVDYALQELIRHYQQKKLLELKGKVKWKGNLKKMRESRNFK